MGTEAAPPRGEFAVTLPFGPEAALTARLMVARLLEEHACPAPLVHDGRLVVHELVVNGVTHGEPDDEGLIAVSCRVSDSEVLISVLDRGQTGALVARAPSSRRANGRGLAIVQALCETWSVDRSHGTRVSAWLAR